MLPQMVDCLVVGAGPAGLTAAIYLARFHLDVLVVDAGHSRAASIPKTRNHAGFPEGISGPNLLRRMNQQARMHGAQIAQGTVHRLKRQNDAFEAEVSSGVIGAHAILLATGVTNIRPDMPDDLHDEALARGLLRYCPICDAYEVTDQAIGVIGAGERGVKEALFLRGYSRDITLISPEEVYRLDEGQRDSLKAADIRILSGRPSFRLSADKMIVDVPAGSFSFASVYPALGSEVRSELAVHLGAEVSSEGCLMVDAHQRTSVAGLYAAGDVVLGLDQISHAMGEGGVAATTIRNDLAAQVPIFR